MGMVTPSRVVRINSHLLMVLRIANPSDVGDRAPEPANPAKALGIWDLVALLAITLERLPQYPGSNAAAVLPPETQIFHIGKRQID